MSLRLRLTLVVAVTFALVVVGCVYAAHLSASQQLRSETDTFLAQRSARFTHPGPGEFPAGGHDADDGFGGPGDGPALADPDAVTQILNSKGNVVSYITGQPKLTVDAKDRQLAQSGGEPRYRDITVGDDTYRVLTVALPNHGAVQIARSIEADKDILNSLDARLLLIALAGTLLAASLAWLIARRIVRPIEDLTHTATEVATTQNLDNPITVTRSDEIGRLASSFNSMLDALRTSREQQRRLVLDASHELRTPLTALRTNIDLLRRARNFNEEQRDELIGASDQELQELTDLVSELVELATDTRTEEPVEQIDLGELVERVVSRQQRRGEREIALQLDDAASIVGRVTLLERAVGNLLDNALKFSPATSGVEVEVHGTDVEVLDRGTGIDAADLPHVFDRFYRSPTARTVPGSGLGLAIVEQIAELHGGSVTLAPRAGGGIVARLHLAGTDHEATPAN
jgi:two-component system, OmpR family, sensor histidine kinase MprB